MHLSFSLSPSVSVSLFLLHPRLTFPQTPSRVSPPRCDHHHHLHPTNVRLLSLLPPPSAASFGSSFDSSLSFLPLHLGSSHELTRISHRMDKIVNLDAQRRKKNYDFTRCSRYLYIIFVFICCKNTSKLFFIYTLINIE